MTLQAYRGHLIGGATCLGAVLLAWLWPMNVPGLGQTEAGAVPVAPARVASAQSPAPGKSTAASAPRARASSAGGSAVRPRLWAAEPAPETPPVALNKVKPLTPDYWKISGVYGSGQDRRAIVEFAPPRASEYLQVGATLPNGAQILALEKNSVTVKAKVANQWKTIVLEF